MEASCALSFSSPNTHLFCNLCNSISSSRFNSKRFHSFSQQFQPKPFPKALTFSPSFMNSLCLSPPCVIAEALNTTTESSSTLPKETFSKIDKGGRFYSPRAARELALLIAYAACLEGSDPVCLLDKRVNAKRVPGYVFDEASLLKYDHMSFGGEPVQVETEEEAEELIRKNEKDLMIEAEVLAAPPKLVYNKFVLRLARDLLGAVVNLWNVHALVIDKVIPQNWKTAGIHARFRGRKSTAGGDEAALPLRSVSSPRCPQTNNCYFDDVTVEGKRKAAVAQLSQTDPKMNLVQESWSSAFCILPWQR